MSALVLVVGALIVLAGGYEMVTGSGDILSERGWSAYIAGSVLLAGGVVTMALGLAVRAIDGLRGAMLDLPASAWPVDGSGRIEPEPEEAYLPFQEPTAAPHAMPPPLQPAPAALEVASHATIQAAPDAIQAAPDAIQAAPDAIQTAPPIAAPILAEAVELHPSEPAAVEQKAVEPASPPHVDWLDYSFAELERELASTDGPSNVAPLAARLEPRPTDSLASQTNELALAFAREPPAPVARANEVHAPYPESSLFDEPGSTVHHDRPEAEHPPHRESADAVAMSAQEDPGPSPSPVIGRYESQGTSYVMYADGTIDAQSANGTYRFASMAELKTFIQQ